MTTPSSPTTPAIFEDYFEMGQQESSSPFLKKSSRDWGINLTLKSSVIAAAILVLSFGLSFYPMLKPLSNFLLIVVYFLAGIPSLIEAIEDLLIFEINIDVLMTLAAFSSVLIGSGTEGALLLVLFALSGSMEDAVTSKAKSAISSLHKLSPTKATVVESDGTYIERAVSDIPVGAHILVKSGQVVPLDGQVIEGRSSVNLVHLTGENLPVTKAPGDLVPAGARNLEGALTLTITRSQADSTLAQIIQLVTQAQEARPKLQRWFDQFSKTYAISIITFAFVFALALPLLISLPFFGQEGSVYRALTFLIAASPCALIIAIPIAYLSALSICARKGVVLKGGVTLDALAKCQIVVFDKTGTLTTGELSFKGINNLKESPFSDEEVLSIAFALEKNAVHPIAKAIVDFAQQQQIKPFALEKFVALPGQGLQGEVTFKESLYAVSIGQPEFILTQLDQASGDLVLKKVQELRSHGFLVAVLAIGSYPYVLHFVDTPRKHIQETLKALHAQDLQTIMLTGDHHENAARNAKEMGIGTFYADLKPEDKLQYITHFSKEKNLAMIGDGINDAPALARATVGIAMGKVGNTAALDAADIILLQDNIEILDWLFKKAHQTQKIVKQNLGIAIGAMLIAVLPSLFGFIPLWLAVTLHEGGTVLVGLNALRLLRS